MRPSALLLSLVAGVTAPSGAVADEVGPFLAVSGASPFVSCFADEAIEQPGATFVGTEVEPRLAVNPKNPKNLVGVFQQDRWSNGGARGIGAGVSFDGGATWRNAAVPKLSLCSGGAWKRVSDPWVSFAPNGDVYLVALALGVEDREPREFHDLRTPIDATLPAGDNAVLVMKSTDGGLTWADPVTLIRDLVGPLNDKESVTADPTDPTGRLVYVVWDRLNSVANTTRGPAMFSRTTDGGATWDAARAIFDPGPYSSTLGNQVLVLPDGRVLDFFTEFALTQAPTGQYFYRVFLSFVASSDKGQTWSDVTRATQIGGPPVFDPEAPREVRHGAALADVAVDARSGALYAAWTQRVPPAHAGDPTVIVLSGSTDGGRTWATFGDQGRFFVNRTPLDGLDGQAFTPSVRVAASGTVGVTYYDFRHNDSGPGTLTDYWLVRCEPRPFADCRQTALWTQETRVTPASFDIEKAPYAYGLFLGDYEGLTTDGDDFLALFAVTQPADRASVVFRRIRP